jgi:hypothetical protein
MGSDGDLPLNAPIPTSSAEMSAPSAPPAVLSPGNPLRRAGLVVLAAAMSVVMLFSPVKLCLTAVALHLPCPGCGMTRATLALLRGDFARAVAIHPLAPAIAPFVTGLLVVQAIAYVRTGQGLGTARVPRAIEQLGAALVILLFGVWLARFGGCFGGPVSLR